MKKILVSIAAFGALTATAAAPAMAQDYHGRGPDRGYERGYEQGQCIGAYALALKTWR